MQANLLNAIVIVMGLSVAVAWVFRLAKLPAIMGFLLTGMVIGPSGWQLIPPESVDQFAELGLVLLLFTVGLELSPEPLIRSGLRLIMASALQLAGTMAVAVLALQLAAPTRPAANLVIGLAIALSSTAIILKQMSDRGETSSTTGLITTGILLLQDIVVIVVLLVLSVVSLAPGATWQGAALRNVGAMAGLAAVVAIAPRALPLVLAQVARHGGRELITLFAVMMASGGALLAHLAGWSPALGACIAGLLLAGADQRHQLVAEVTPFRDVFNALFFVSLGMSVKLGVVIAHPLVVAGAVVATLALKSVLAGGAVCAAGWPLRIGLQVGIGLCTVSEFSYVLVREGYHAHLVPGEALDAVVAYAVGTMVLGALVYPAAAPAARLLARHLGREGPGAAATTQEAEAVPFRDHVMLVGYGVTGANLGRMLRSTQIPHCVVEMNQALVARARAAGSPVVVGDATRMALLERAGIDTARVLVVAVNDKQATQRIVAQANARRPELYILARTGFLSDIETLYERGAKLVIPADFETSIEVAAHVLRQFGIPDNIVEAQIAAVRSGRYGMLRGKPTDRAATAELLKILERTATQTFYLGEESYVCGRTVAAVNLRALTGCTIIAVVRSGNPTTNPAPDFVFSANDVLVLVGTHRQIELAKAFLQRGEAPSEAAGPLPA